MKKYAILLILMFHFISQAQEPPPPYDGDFFITYYESNAPNELNNILIGYNVCLESFIRLNPDVDITNIPYGTRLRLPKDEPCYRYVNRDDNPYNDFGIGNGIPNRLRFYENGVWLNEPYLSTDVVYMFSQTPQDIANTYGVCLDALLAENYLLQNDLHDDVVKLMNIIDVFIPDNLPKCDPVIDIIVAPDDYFVIEVKGSFIMNPLAIAQEYGVCPEAIKTEYLDGVRYGFYDSIAPNFIYIPKDEPPCYNEQGQRLTYFDDNNQRLQIPVYSDLLVYITQPYQKLPDIADELGVCLVDLIRINQFPDLPLSFSIELFIPPARPCPDNIEILSLKTYSIPSLHILRNICPEIIAQFNPHLIHHDKESQAIYWRSGAEEEHFILLAETPCYQSHLVSEGTSLYELERELNICFEEFMAYRNDGQFTAFLRFTQFEVTLYIRLDAPPCYDEQGRRLLYPDGVYYYPSLTGWDRHRLPTYSDMRVYHSQMGDSLYDISVQFNVCVRDLLVVNPMLRHLVPQGHPVFIPNVRPCYDEATGKQLIYEDNFGNPLPQPILSEYLVHYGAPIPSYLPYYYNVCLNRIWDANEQADFERLAHYEGYIIPTDRPPCFDDTWEKADYVCYDQPIGNETVYLPNSTMTFDIEGAYCYDIKDPKTVIWYENVPYHLFYKPSWNITQGLVAWCLGVSVDELSVIRQNDTLNQISHAGYYSWLTPLPTRDCYLTNPSILDGKTVHIVTWGDTLSSIGQEYGVPYPLIAWANGLDADNIWLGQKLIIPTGARTEDLVWLLGLWAGWFILAIPIYGRRWVKRHQ